MTYKIIQLGHPGGEWPRQGVNGVIRSKLGITWNVDRFSGTREWNIRDHHYRKFILAEDVEYIDDLKSEVRNYPTLEKDIFHRYSLVDIKANPTKFEKGNQLFKELALLRQEDRNIKDVLSSIRE